MSNLFDNLINQNLNDGQNQQVRDGFRMINDAMPFLIGLNAEQRQRLPKIAAGNLNFVQDARSAMADNPEMLPGYMTIDNLSTDLSLYKQLDPLVQLAKQTYEKLRDTQMLAGSEAYVAALAFYRMVEAAAKAGLPGADAVYDQLKERFMNQASSSVGEEPTDSETP